MTTRYNYQLAAAQLADYLADIAASGELAADDSDAVDDPTDVQRKHVEMFLAWMLETRSASTALNKYKSLQQFFRYLVEDEEMTRHPMDRIRQPTGPEKLVPVVDDDELGRLLDTCASKSFLDRRDAAIIRLLLDTGARLAEITLLDVDALDLRRDIVVVRGKGDRQRAIPFGERTGQALTRYLRVRAKHKAADLEALFLREKGRERLAPNGVKLMLRRRGDRAGIDRMHAHRLRHTLAHQWQLNGGNETDLMAIMGWESPEMLRRYGKAAASVRAESSHRRMASATASERLPAGPVTRVWCAGPMDRDLTPEQRSLRARLAAHASWANTADRAARTAAARKAAHDRFDRQVDPDGTLPPDERAKRAANARAAHCTRMALRSARVRQTRGRCHRPRAAPHTQETPHGITDT